MSDIGQAIANRDAARARRERIATAVLQGMAASGRLYWDEAGPVIDGQAERAVRLADALIEALDR